MARSKYERETQKKLEAEGYIVDWKIRPSGFKMPIGYNVDYFGLFDLIAFKDGELRLIAVKGRQYVPSPLRRGIEKFGVKKIVKEIWQYDPKRKSGRLKREVIH